MIMRTALGLMPVRFTVETALLQNPCDAVCAEILGHMLQGADPAMLNEIAFLITGKTVGGDQ